MIALLNSSKEHKKVLYAQPFFVYLMMMYDAFWLYNCNKTI